MNLLVHQFDKELGAYLLLKMGVFFHFIYCYITIDFYLGIFVVWEVLLFAFSSLAAVATTDAIIITVITIVILLLLESVKRYVVSYYIHRCVELNVH